MDQMDNAEMISEVVKELKLKGQAEAEFRTNATELLKKDNEEGVRRFLSFTHGLPPVTITALVTLAKKIGKYNEGYVPSTKVQKIVRHSMAGAIRTISLPTD